MTIAKTTHWLTRDGAIRTHFILTDGDQVVAESGEQAPPGTELTVSGLIEVFRRQLIDQIAAHDASQEAAVANAEAAVAAHEAKVEMLSNAGFSQEVIDVILPQPPQPHVSRPYSLPSAAVASMIKYGLTQDDIQKVVRGLTTIEE